MEYKKLSEFKGEDAAWDVIAELIEPLSEIASNLNLAEKLKDKDAKKSEIAKVICKDYKTPATKILAILSDTNYETFKESVTPADILLGVITVLNDKELTDLFLSQG